MKRRVKNGLQFLIKPFITSTFFLPFRGKEEREGEGECLQTDIKMSKDSRIRGAEVGVFGVYALVFIDTVTAIGSTKCGQPTWTKCRCQPHHHSWLRPLSVMEGKWSDGRLLAAPSQMAAGTALRLADNQRTSKLRRALKPISAQSQEAKGTEQRKETAIGKNWGSQKSQQAWKWAALDLSSSSGCFVCNICSHILSHKFTQSFSPYSVPDPFSSFSTCCVFLIILLPWKQLWWHISMLAQKTKYIVTATVTDSHPSLSSSFFLIWLRSDSLEVTHQKKLEVEVTKCAVRNQISEVLKFLFYEI